MPDEDPLPSLDEFQEKIDQVKSRADDGENTAYPSEGGGVSGYGRAMNMAVEFIAGAAVGGTGGYFLDAWLDTSPLFLLTGFLLGFAAGVRNLMRGMSEKK